MVLNCLHARLRGQTQTRPGLLRSTDGRQLPGTGVEGRVQQPRADAPAFLVKCPQLPGRPGWNHLQVLGVPVPLAPLGPGFPVTDPPTTGWTR